MKNLMIPFLWLIGLATCCSPAAGQVPVEVVLHPYPLYTQSLNLRVGDIAEVRGGSPVVQQKIQALDLELMAADDSSATITAQQLYYRLRLAKISEKNFTIIGPESLTVLRTTTPEIIASISRRCQYALSQHWNCAEDEVQFAVEPFHLQPLLREHCHPEQCRWAIRYPDSPPVGLTRLELQLQTPGNKTLTLFLPFRHTSGIAQTIQPVQYQTAPPSGYVANPNAAWQQTDAVSLAAPTVGSNALAEYRSAAMAGPESATGIKPLAPQAVAMPAQTRPELPSALPSRQTVRNTAQTRASPSDSLVKVNQAVTLVLESGPVTLKLRNARALQKGSIGDVIEVRNPRNPQVVLFGRIVDAQTVRIEN